VLQSRFNILFLIVFIFVIVVGCVNKQPLDNPFDLNNPYYIKPSVEIIQGPEDNAILDRDSIYFEWQGSKDEMLFKYYDLMNESWSGWSNNKSVLFVYLDEGHYSFLLKGKYISGDSTDNPVTLNFEIDAILGPSVRLVKKYNQVAVNSTFYLDIIADGIDTTLAAEIIIDYDPDYVECQQFILGTFYGSIDNQIAFDSINVETGTFILDVGCYGRDQYAHGSGLIGKMVFRALQNSNCEININKKSSFRILENCSLTNILYYKSIIEIE